MRNIVRELRDSLGLTQEEFGQEFRVSRQTVISIEVGRHTPSLALALNMAKFFGKTVEEVFFLDDAEPVHTGQH